jgi:hypothetical protein
MNSKIFSHITKKLSEVWHLPQHARIRENINADTDLESLPWTPARRKKFIQSLESTFGVSIELRGTVGDLTERTDQRYLAWFFGEVWKPRTENYYWTGWRIADEINKLRPKNVLDVGCGYNPFKGRIPNLIGIDPYNNCADYMVDILNYDVEPQSHDHIIALGSINFNSRNDIEIRFAKCIELLEPGGHLWMRANPGHDHATGPWVELFPWSFSVAHDLARQFNIRLESLKQDQDRLFLLFNKS